MSRKHARRRSKPAKLYDCRIPRATLMSEFMKALKVSELPVGSMKTVKVDGEDVLIVNVDGKFYGMGAICKHEEWDLSEGTLDDHKVMCAGHGSIWDLATGKAEFSEPLDDEPLYDVKEEDGFLYVRRRG